MIPRTAQGTLRKLAKGHPVLLLTGPRQSGKTTLARATFPRKPYVSLENPEDRRFAAEDPRGFLARFRNGAVIDEAQHCPDLFSYLQTRVTQSLAGRAGRNNGTRTTSRPPSSATTPVRRSIWWWSKAPGSCR